MQSGQLKVEMFDNRGERSVRSVKIFGKAKNSKWLINLRSG